jgi:hypothetical protein
VLLPAKWVHTLITNDCRTTFMEANATTEARKRRCSCNDDGCKAPLGTLWCAHLALSQQERFVVAVAKPEVWYATRRALLQLQTEKGVLASQYPIDMGDWAPKAD